MPEIDRRHPGSDAGVFCCHHPGRLGPHSIERGSVAAPQTRERSTMGYSHAENLARMAAGTPAAEAEADAPATGPTSEARLTPQIDPRLYDREDVRCTLTERDIGALYGALNDAGCRNARSPS